MSDKALIKGRRRARKIAVQALYQQHISLTPLSDITAEFRAIHHDSKTDFEYFMRLIQGVHEQQEMIDETFKPFLDREIDALNPIELVVIRLGTFELLEVRETPYRVILDEAITLTKTFGAQDGHKYVNGILHALAKTLRSAEIKG